MGLKNTLPFTRPAKFSVNRMRPLFTPVRFVLFIVVVATIYVFSFTGEASIQQAPGFAEGPSPEGPPVSLEDTPAPDQPGKIAFYEKVDREKGPIASDPSTHTRNSTLGFGKIYYTSLPNRRDRQDAMELIASVTNLSLTYIPGVLDTDFGDKERPISTVGPGCWRAHADTWKTMLRENIETALVIEDDVDWDINIHEVMEDLSRAMRDRSANGPKFRVLEGSEWTEEEYNSAPYGLDWDLLWVGHCMHTLADEPEVRDMVHFYSDKNMPMDSSISGDKYHPQTYVGQLDRMLKNKGLEDTWRGEQEKNLNSSGEWLDQHIDSIPHPRMFLPLAGTQLCTWGYAVTRRGAQRMLYHLGFKDYLPIPIDNAMAELVRTGALMSYTVIPPIFNDWRTGSKADSDNDAQYLHGESSDKTPLAEGSTRNIRLSVREAIPSLIAGTDPVKSSVKDPFKRNWWKDVFETRRKQRPGYFENIKIQDDLKRSAEEAAKQNSG